MSEVIYASYVCNFTYHAINNMATIMSAHVERVITPSASLMLYRNRVNEISRVDAFVYTW